jgi:hypothetical protein
MIKNNCSLKTIQAYIRDAKEKKKKPNQKNPQI